MLQATCDYWVNGFNGLPFFRVNYAVDPGMIHVLEHEIIPELQRSLGFASIHPYADGNGQMARLLSNIPLLRTGFPPILISASQRREYISLLGDYTLTRGEVTPDQALILPSPQRDAILTFFTAQAKTSQQLVEKFHKRQASRP